MKNNRKKRILLPCILYLTGLIAGIAAILFFPYHHQYANLINYARDNARYYLEYGHLNITGNFGLDFLVYDADGNCVEKLVSGLPESVYNIDVDEALSRSGNGTALFYKRIVITAQNGSRSQLSLITAMPLTQNDVTVGSLIMIRGLSTTEHDITAYIIVWSVIFFLQFLFLHRLHKTEEKFDRLQRSYIAALNHELKSPITSIKALSEALLDGYGNDPEKQLLYHSTILKEAQVLEDTVCEILELSKLQHAKDIYRKQWSSPEETFAPTLARYARLCEDIDLHFSATDLCTAALPQLYTAPALIARVLDLLLHNAVKFTPEETGEISVDIREKAGHIEICVRDNGCGISKDDLPHIFERFYRSNTGQNTSGSGLGLSIVQEIIMGLHENISVNSTIGGGTVFTFTVGTKAGRT